MRGFAVRLLLLLLPASAVAQDTTRVTVPIRNLPVAVALDRLVAASGISLAYRSELLGAQRVTCPDDPAPAETVLRCIVRAAGLDFQRLSSGTYLIAPSPADPPAAGALVARVVDAASGAPIAEARVQLLPVGTVRTAVAEGHAAFTALAPGRYRVAAAALGFAPAVRVVEVAADARTEVHLALTRAPFTMAPLIVNGLAADAPRALGGDGLRLDSLASVALPPGVLLDGAAGLLGVARRAALGDLHIQGGESGEHQFRLDGVPVYEPFSLARTSGAFSPLALDRLVVRKAGFGAPFGSYTAGVVDIEQALGTVQARPTLTTLTDPFSANARATVPLGMRERRGTLMLAGRQSLWGLYQPPTLDNTLRQWNVVDPVLLGRLLGTPDSLAAAPLQSPQVQTSDIRFTDLHAATRLEVGAVGVLRASAWYGTNRLATGLFGVEEDPEDGPVRVGLSEDTYRWSSLAAQLALQQRTRAGGSRSVQARLSRHRLNHTYASLTGEADDSADAGANLPRFERLLRDAQSAFPSPDEGNSLTELAITGAMTIPARRVTVEVGAELARTSSTLQLENGVFRPIALEAAASRGTLMTQLQLDAGRGWQLELGQRATWLAGRRAIALEPRAALEHRATFRSGATLATRLAGGVYRQFTNQLDVPTVGPSSLVPALRFWLPADPEIAPPETRHLSVEAIAALPGGWTVRAEGYDKSLTLINAFDYSTLLAPGPDPQELESAEAFIRPSRGTARGVGVRITRDAGWLRAEAAYDRAEARRTFPGRFGGRAQPTPWNEPHRAQFSLDVHPTASFSAAVRARGVWGRAWGLRQAYFDLLGSSTLGAGLPIGDPGEDRLPALLEVDAGASWRWSIGGARMELGAALLNVFDRVNVADFWLRPAATGSGVTRVARPLLGRQPVLTLRATL